MKNGEKPARPIQTSMNPQSDGAGLTKREYFAAMAMQGMVTDSRIGFEKAAMDAVMQADALLKALEK